MLYKVSGWNGVLDKLGRMFQIEHGAPTGTAVDMEKVSREGAYDLAPFAIIESFNTARFASRCITTLRKWGCFDTSET
jgi:hypothetical protein